MECPLCKGTEVETVYTNKGIAYQQRDVETTLVVSYCNYCGFVFQESAYSEQYDNIIANEYKNYNKSEIFPFPNKSEENLHTFNIIMQFISPEKKPNILEIGSNRGDLLYLIKQEAPNVNIMGLEPTKASELKVPTINGFFRKELFLNKFDFIIMQHVLEHIKNPKEFMEDVSHILSDDGLLYIEVPNLEMSLKYYAEDFTLDHVSYFNYQSLERVLCNFKIIKYELSPFLRIVAEKKEITERNIQVKSEQLQNIKENFSELQKKKRELIEKIIAFSQANKQIIFYGVGYYYRILYKELNTFINKKNCFFMDDNFNGEIETSFHLKKVKSPDMDCMVIICSNNFKVQDKIEKKLLCHKGLKILRPWFRLVTV